MLTTLLMGSSEKIITKAEFQMSQENPPEDMESKDSDSAGQQASTSMIMLDPPVITETTWVGKPKKKIDTPGIEYFIPRQLTTKFTSMPKEQDFSKSECVGTSQISSDKRKVSLDEKSDSRDSMFPIIRANILSQFIQKKQKSKNMPFDYCHTEQQRERYQQKLSQKNEGVEVVFQKHRTEEAHRAETLHQQ